MSAFFEIHPPPPNQPEQPLLEIELVPLPPEDLVMGHLEKAATIATLAWTNPNFADQPEVPEALSATLELLRPPADMPQSLEELLDPQIAGYYIRYEHFGKVKNKQSGKLEHVPGNELAETQLIWKRLHRTCAVLEQIQAHQVVEIDQAELAGKVLRSLINGVEKGRISLPPPEVN